MKSVLFFLILALLLNVVLAAPSKKEFGICSCFRPAYDVGCCAMAKGKLYTDGGAGKYSNTCDTPDFGNSVTKFKDCCAAIKGEVKCKMGQRA